MGACVDLHKFQIAHCRRCTPSLRTPAAFTALSEVEGIRTTWPGSYPWSLRLGIKHFLKLHPELIIPDNQEVVGMPKKGDRVRAVHAIGGPRPWCTVKRVCIPAVLLLFDHNHAGKSLRLRQKQRFEVAAVSAVKCGTFQSFERSGAASKNESLALSLSKTRPRLAAVLSIPSRGKPNHAPDLLLDVAFIP